MGKKSKKKKTKEKKKKKTAKKKIVTEIVEESNVDEQIERVQAILGIAIDEENEEENEEEMEVNDRNLEKYLAYLTKNIDFSGLVTGMDDFRWEEYYIFGPGDDKEYEELKKTHPSCTDKYKILGFDEDDDVDDGILVNVERISDKKQFTLPLADLEAVDRNSSNYQILADYSMWYWNYR